MGLTGALYLALVFSRETGARDTHCGKVLAMGFLGGILMAGLDLGTYLWLRAY